MTCAKCLHWQLDFRGGGCLFCFFIFKTVLFGKSENAFSEGSSCRTISFSSLLCSFLWVKSKLQINGSVIISQNVLFSTWPADFPKCSLLLRSHGSMAHQPHVLAFWPLNPLPFLWPPPKYTALHHSFLQMSPLFFFCFDSSPKYFNLDFLTYPKNKNSCWKKAQSCTVKSR